MSSTKHTHQGKRSKHRGSIAVMAALTLVMVVGFMAFSVDYGYIVVTESELQNAADAASLSGAIALTNGRASAVAAAKAWAAKNVAGGESVIVKDEDVEFGLWNEETATFTAMPSGSTLAPKAIRITCRRSASAGNPLRLFFAPVIGSKTADLAVTATAKIKREVCGLFVGIQSVDIRNAKIDSYNSSIGDYAGTELPYQGDVCSDGPITLSSQGYVYGDARPGAGSSVNRPGRVSGSTAPCEQPITWEPVDVIGPSLVNDNATIPLWALTDDDQRLHVKGSKVLNLAPGTYYLPKGLRTSGDGRINISGPTKLVLNGSVDVEGIGLVNQTSAPANLRIEIVSATAQFDTSAPLSADIYAPTTALKVKTTDDSEFYGAILAKSIVMEGSEAELHGDVALRSSFDAYTSRVLLKQ